MAHKWAGFKVRDILRRKKSSIRFAPLPPASTSWSEIEDMTWEEIEDGARLNRPGFKMIRKLLADQRFDR
jgi:hypothetical protein